MTDLLSLKQDFCDIVQKAQPWILSHFVMWLDLKVAEYKVYGYMVLEQSTNLTSEPKDPSVGTSHGNSIWTSSANNQDTASSQSSTQQFSRRAPCLVVPRPSLSTDRTPTSSSSSVIPTATTPIFKRPLFGGRPNRRKQQHVFRRSSTSLLTALSSDIYNTVGIQKRDEDERKNPAAGSHLQDSELSITSSVSQSTTDTRPGYNVDASSHAEIVIDDSPSVSQSASPLANSPDGSSTQAHEDKTQQSPNMLADSRSGDTGIRRQSCTDIKCFPSTDDMKVLSTQYEDPNRSNEDCVVVKETSDDKSDDAMHVPNEDVQCAISDDTKNEAMQKGLDNSDDENNGSPSSDTHCSSSLSLSGCETDTASHSKIPGKGSNLLNRRQGLSSSLQDEDLSQLSCIKQETIGGIQIKLEPFDTSSNDLYYQSPGSSTNSILHQQLSYSTSNMASPGYLEGIDWNAVNFNRYLDSSQTFANESSPTSSNQNVQRSPNVSSPSSSKNDPSLTCNLCGAVFRFKSSLSRHKTLHGEKRFHCFVCPKAFHRREHLLLHLQRHANSAMITCPVCHMQASSVKHLEEHYRLNHGPFKRTGVLPYLARDNSR